MTCNSDCPTVSDGGTKRKAGSKGKQKSSKGSTEVNTTVKLRREIGLLEAVSISVGSMVGSGIFVTPKGVLVGCGSIGLSLIIWVVSGVLTMTGALCYAELGTSIPGSGGTYIYLDKAFGPLPAFLFLYTTILISAPCTLAVLGLTFANYVVFPFFSIGCSLPEVALRLIAASTLILLTFFNCYAVRGTVKAQNVFMITKLSALLLIIIFGIIHVAKGNVENFMQPFENTILDPGSISIAFYSGFFSYGGWSTLNFITEELKEPTKNLPRAIYISLPLVTFIYIMANTAYFAVISPSEILMSSAIAVTFAEKLFGCMAWVMPLFVAVATVGSLSIHILSCSRLVYVAGRAGHCPVLLSHLQLSCLTPTPALVFLCIMSLIYLTTADIYILITYLSYVNSLANLGVIVGMLYMRKSEPAMERPIKVSIIHPILYLITSIFAVILPVYVRPIEVCLAIVITLTGIPVFHFLITKKHSSGSWWVELNQKFTFLSQKVFVAVVED